MDNGSAAKVKDSGAISPLKAMVISMQDYARDSARTSDCVDYWADIKFVANLCYNCKKACVVRITKIDLDRVLKLH